MNSIFTLDVVKREKERKEGRKERAFRFSHYVKYNATHTHTHTKAAVILFGQGFSHVSLEPAELKKYFVTVHPENTCEK